MPERYTGPDDPRQTSDGCAWVFFIMMILFALATFIGNNGN